MSGFAVPLLDAANGPAAQPVDLRFFQISDEQPLADFDFFFEAVRSRLDLFVPEWADESKLLKELRSRKASFDEAEESWIRRGESSRRLIARSAEISDGRPTINAMATDYATQVTFKLIPQILSQGGLATLQEEALDGEFWAGAATTIGVHDYVTLLDSDSQLVVMLGQRSSSVDMSAGYLAPPSETTEVKDVYANRSTDTRLIGLRCVKEEIDESLQVVRRAHDLHPLGLHYRLGNDGVSDVVVSLGAFASQSVEEAIRLRSLTKDGEREAQLVILRLDAPLPGTYVPTLPGCLQALRNPQTLKRLMSTDAGVEACL